MEWNFHSNISYTRIRKHEKLLINILKQIKIKLNSTTIQCSQSLTNISEYLLHKNLFPSSIVYYSGKAFQIKNWIVICSRRIKCVCVYRRYGSVKQNVKSFGKGNAVPTDKLNVAGDSSSHGSHCITYTVNPFFQYTRHLTELLEIIFRSS